jgi:hypothetical protein
MPSFPERSGMLQLLKKWARSIKQQKQTFGQVAFGQ